MSFQYCFFDFLACFLLFASSLSSRIPTMKKVTVEFHVIIGKEEREPENNPGLWGMLASCLENFFFLSLTSDLTFPLMRSNMLMLSLNFICNNSPMEALTASSANECGTATFCRKGKKKIFSVLPGILPVWKNQINQKNNSGT